MTTISWTILAVATTLFHCVTCQVLPTAQCQCSAISQCYIAQQQQRSQVRTQCLQTCAQQAGFPAGQSSAVVQCETTSGQASDTIDLAYKQCLLTSGQQCQGSSTSPVSPVTGSLGQKIDDDFIERLSPAYKAFEKCVKLCQKYNGTMVPNQAVVGRRKRDGNSMEDGGISCAAQNNCVLYQANKLAKQICKMQVAPQKATAELAECQCLATALGLTTMSCSATV